MELVTDQAGSQALSPEIVRSQLNHILADPVFNHSRRCAQFLRHVTELALADRTKIRTERDLGIDIFGRPPDYDTEADPIVRVTASEIRKRLAKYYANPEHADEIRIELQRGSYLAEFHVAHAEPAAEAGQGQNTTWDRKPKATFSRRTKNLFVCTAIVLAALASLLWLARPAPSSLSVFWDPLISVPGTVSVFYAQLSAENLHVVGLADPRFEWTDSLTPIPDPIEVEWRVFAEHLVYEHDMQSACRISEFMGSMRKHMRLKGSNEVTIRELRDTPAIFLGGFNNQWTRRLLPDVRFSFSGQGTLRFIRDRENPASTQWSFDTKVRPRVKDLIIVTRVSDSPTGQPAVFVGGFSNWGTDAAVAFITDPNHMQAALSSAPNDWKRKNLQIVLEATVVGADSGVPHVLATYFW